MTQTMTIKDTRNRLADIVNQVAIAGDTFIITKFGKPKAMIIPVSESTKTKESAIEESFGAWGGRKDIKDSNRWVNTLRKKMSLRLHE